MTTDTKHKQSGSRRNTIVAASCVAGVVGMIGLAYASVPLYRIFCQVTGYGGTTQVAESASTKVLERTITVRFDANTSRGLAWKFKPVQKQITLKIGENGLAFFEATNLTARKIAGTATFNVTPQAVGSYFNKTACFCFTEQVLKPGERVDMPVAFFIDPAIVDDPNLKTVDTITLSYTFFPLRKSASLKKAQPNNASQ